jgi:hypothetical protein
MVSCTLAEDAEERCAHTALIPATAPESSGPWRVRKQVGKTAEVYIQLSLLLSGVGQWDEAGAGDLPKPWAYITDLICDFPDVAVDLQVGVANPLMEVKTVVNLADFLLRILGSHHLYHVRHNVDFHLVLFIHRSVQAL